MAENRPYLFVSESASIIGLVGGLVGGLVVGLVGSIEFRQVSVLLSVIR